MGVGGRKDRPIPSPLQLLTTGGVRFNPNLYACGKVCLSLLGTWAGGRGEGWIAGTSTMLQVVLSIQALILVETPYYNEPGYESGAGGARAEKAAAEYTQRVRGERQGRGVGRRGLRQQQQQPRHLRR